MKRTLSITSFPSTKSTFFLLGAFLIATFVMILYVSSSEAQGVSHIIQVEPRGKNKKVDRFVTLKVDENLSFQVSPSPYQLPAFPVDCLTSDQWRFFSQFYSSLSAVQKKQLLSEELILSANEMEKIWSTSSFSKILGYEGGKFEDYVGSLGRGGSARYVVKVEPTL